MQGGTRTNRLLLAVLVLSLGTLAAGCGNRMIVGSSTSLGLVASTGDARTRPPSVSLAFKRAELALIPTGQLCARQNQKKNNTNSPNTPTPTDTDTLNPSNTDTFSSMMAFYFESDFFAYSELDQFIAIGWAARNILGDDPAEGSAFTRQIAGTPSIGFFALRTIHDGIKEKLGDDFEGKIATGIQQSLDRYGSDYKFPDVELWKLELDGNTLNLEKLQDIDNIFSDREVDGFNRILEFHILLRNSSRALGKSKKREDQQLSEKQKLLLRGFEQEILNNWKVRRAVEYYAHSILGLGG